MAENVNRNMENTVEELQEMVRTNLLKPEEMREAIRRRKAFEYKVNGTSKSIDHFKSFIQFETNLLQLINWRRRKFSVLEKTGSIEHKASKRLKNLYEIALRYFPDDLPLCMSYLKFSKTSQNFRGCIEVLNNLTSHHQKNPSVWQLAARWYFQNRNDAQSSLKMLHKGLALNKDSKLLYTDAIKLEIFHNLGKDAYSKDTETSDELKEKQKLCLNKLESYLQAIFKNISDFSYYLDLLTFLESFKFTADTQKQIVKYLLEQFADEPKVWTMLAIRERKGFNYNSGPDSLTPRRKLVLCIEKYKEGLQKVPPTKRLELWNLYIDYLIEMQTDDFGLSKVLKETTLKEAYEQASEEGFLSEKYYLSWIQFTTETHTKYKIAEKGTETYPESVLLWRHRFYLKQDLVFGSPSADAEINRIFELGVAALKENASTLWNAIMRYHLLNSDRDVQDRIYKDAVTQPGEVGREFKPRYITWLNINKGIKAARIAYHMLVSMKPYCKELHEAMWRAESTEIDFDFDAWVEVHKHAVEQFGSEDVDVWIDYLRFYMLYNKNQKSVKECVESVRDKARKVLPEYLRLEFEDKYKALEELATRED